MSAPRLTGTIGVQARAHHEKKAERIIKCIRALCRRNRLDDLETSGGEENAEGEPKPSVRGESGCRDGVSHGERPR